eukprot:gnl/TRDRNA2_/TRDRNA2_64549_c0_seq1.p1 gnl/TRDRNA2_/TRDRNA2_64549_c0~~gnl/TRDRNA2_/TRDRNA2_64549_c0_seq1.p1  ORF type:complete len:680 (+),score=125.28 gnl/TRDRNA2_/TRDRNA2_64549_c0_seq1:68-2041(+)
MSLVTTESLKDELDAFARQTYRPELEAIGRRIQADVRAEIKAFLANPNLLKLQQRSLGGPRAAGLPDLPEFPDDWMDQEAEDLEDDGYGDHGWQRKGFAMQKVQAAQEYMNGRKSVVQMHQAETVKPSAPPKAPPKSRKPPGPPPPPPGAPPMLKDGKPNSIRDESPEHLNGKEGDAGHRRASVTSKKTDHADDTKSAMIKINTSTALRKTKTKQRSRRDSRDNLDEVQGDYANSVALKWKRTSYDMADKIHSHFEEVEQQQLQLERSGDNKITPVGLLRNSKFDYVVGFVILLNALVIGLQTDYRVRHPHALSNPSWWSVVDRIFAVIFLLELLLRLVAHGCWFFCQPNDWRWNWFDFGAVMCQVIEETFLLVGAGSLGSFMTVMRVLRLLRIVRVFRVLRLIDELRAIVISIMNSMGSLLWTLALLFLMQYVLGVFLTQLHADYLKGGEGYIDAETEEELRIYFGQLLRSILSLYEAMTGGKDWDDLATPLMKLNPVLGPFFVLYIAFALLALMNVVTGVFVESALKSAKDDQEHNTLNQLHKLFSEADEDRSGKLSWKEFESKLEAPAFLKVLQNMDVEPNEAKELFKLIDIDDSGEIDYEEFISGFLRLRGPAKAIDLTMVMHEARRSSRVKLHLIRRIDRRMGELTKALPGA